MSARLGFQKNKKIIILALLLVVLGVAATMLANQCSFLPCEEPAPPIIPGLE